MDATPFVGGTDVALADAERMLREHGALFAYLHGSRVDGRARQASDLDIGAFFGRDDVHAWDLHLPGSVDLLVLDTAPLELAGRVALFGRLFFENDTDQRLVWEATTRKIFLDERPRIERAHREFMETLRRG